MTVPELDYRKILKATLLEKKAQLGRIYTFEKMATACRVQKTYLSKVLKGDGHLTEDQLYLACDYLRFNEEEREYLFLLRAEERSSIKKRKKELEGKIKKKQADLTKTDKHISALIPANDAAMADYYCDPNVQLVHIYLTIPEYQKNVSRIGDRLGLKGQYLANILDKLQAMGLMTLREGKYQSINDNLHLPAGSPLYPSWRTLVRVRALERFQRGFDEEAYSFSVVFSANDTVRLKIKEMFLKFLKETQKLTEKAELKEVYQMNFDLFGW